MKIWVVKMKIYRQTLQRKESWGKTTIQQFKSPTAWIRKKSIIKKTEKLTNKKCKRIRNKVYIERRTKEWWLKEKGMKVKN